jgi:DNA-binding response OmpR family regulator
MGMNFGADDYLTKPVVRDDLLAAVQIRLAVPPPKSAWRTNVLLQPRLQQP